LAGIAVALEDDKMRWLLVFEEDAAKSLFGLDCGTLVK